MRLPKFRPHVRTALAVLLVGGHLSAQSVPEVDTKEDVIELSPFEVSSNDDRGYYASQTMAGGRINSKVGDIGTSLQVVTAEFLRDVGAVNANEVLVYTTNTDVSGPSGNVGPTEASAGGVSDVGVRTNSSASNRVRAVGSADLTRNFLRTDIPFDSYNSGRLDILRGANSFLFGLGSPAGIINYSLDRAVMDRDFGSVGYRISSEDLDGNVSNRVEANYNSAIVKDRLALRVAGVFDDKEYIQQGAYDETKRTYGAITFRPLADRNFVIRASYEDGSVKSTPPSALGPVENLSSYLDNPTNINFGGPANRFIGDPFGNVVNLNTVYLGRDASGSPIAENRIPNSNVNVEKRGWALIFDDTVDANGLPTRAVQTGIDSAQYRSGDPLLDPDGNNSAARGLYFRSFSNLGDLAGDFVGWRPQGLVDYSTFDFRKNLLTGGFDRLDKDFDAANVSLEATGWNNQLGIELVYNKETFAQEHFIPIGQPALGYDSNRTHVVGPNSLFGPDNPNFGRVFISGSASGSVEREIDRETYRATAFAKYDFKDRHEGLLGWFGRHQLIGLFDDDTRNERSTAQRIFAFGNDADFHLEQANASQFQRQVPYIIYVSPVQAEAMTDPNFRMQDFQITPKTDVNFNLPADYSVPVAYYSVGNPATGNKAFTSPDRGSRVGAFNPGFGNADGSIVETAVSSYAFNSQSHFLQDSLVVNLGWRKDKVGQTSVQAPATGPESTRNFNSDVFTLEGQPVNEVSEETFSYNLVAKVPQAWLPKGLGLSFHYGKSSNFIPAAESFSIDGDRVPSGSGDSQDYGFTVSTSDNKFVARVNWYKTDIINEPYEPVRFGYAWTATAHMTRRYGQLLETLWSIDRNDDGIMDAGDANGNGIFDDLEGNGSSYPTLAQIRVIRDAYAEQMTPFLRDVNDFTFNQTTGRYDTGNGAFFTVGDTADVSAEGTEVEIIYNPTPTWRIAFNAVHQKASRTNLAPRFGKLFNALVDFWEANPELQGVTSGANHATTPLNNNILTNSTIYGQLITAANAGQTFYRETALEGADNPEVRKWRFNVVSNYEFREGRLKNFNVGGAFRYVDSATIGYGLETVPGTSIIRPAVNTRYNDEAISAFDLWVGYRRKILDNKVDWRIQLNVRDLFADSDPLVVNVQPDGSPARVRYAPPRTFALQNTFSF